MKEVATVVAELREGADFDVQGLDFSPDGKYLAATAPHSHKVHIWDWQDRRLVKILEKVAYGSSDQMATERIRYSPDGRLLATCHGRGSGDVVARIWGTDTWRVVHDIEELGVGNCQAIGFTPDGKSLLRLVDRITEMPSDNLIVYDIQTWQPVWGLRTEGFGPNTLAMSPDGKFVALGGRTGGPGVDGQPQIRIVDMAQRAVVRTIDAYPVHRIISRLAWSPDGIHIAAGEDSAGFNGSAPDPQVVKTFDARTGEQTTGESTAGNPHTKIMALRYTADGKYLVESYVDRRVKIWDGKHKQLLQEIPGWPGSLAVSRDGRFLAMGGDRKILVWRLQ